MEIDDPNDPKIDFNASKIRYTTIFTNALSTCRGFLITGNIDEQPFVCLAHRSKIYEPSSFTPSSTLMELLQDLTDDIEMKFFYNPPPNTLRKKGVMQNQRGFVLATKPKNGFVHRTKPKMV